MLTKRALKLQVNQVCLRMRRRHPASVAAFESSERYAIPRTAQTQVTLLTATHSLDVRQRRLCTVFFNFVFAAGGRDSNPCAALATT
jgi:hypothetical protein